MQLDDQRLARVHGREVPPAVPRTVSEDTGRGLRAGLVESGGVESGGATTARQRALDLLGSRQGRDAEQEVRHPFRIRHAAVIAQRQRPVLWRRAERPPQARVHRPPVRGRLRQRRGGVRLGVPPRYGARVQVHMHVGGWWQRTGPFGRRIPEHPVQEDSVVGPRAPAHQVKRLSDVVAVERAGVAEVGHRAGVRDQFEAGRVQREVVPVRAPVRDRHGARIVLGGGELVSRRDVQRVTRGPGREVVEGCRDAAVHVPTMRPFRLSSRGGFRETPAGWSSGVAHRLIGFDYQCESGRVAGGDPWHLS